MTLGLTTMVGFALGALAPFIVSRIFHLVTISVEEESCALVTRFGRLVALLDRPGLQLCWDRWAPWVRVHHVSMRRDFRDINNVNVHDAEGSAIVLDLWLEYRIVDAAKALFGVDNWDESLQNLISNCATAILSNRSFQDILIDRTELDQALKAQTADEATRWGISVQRVFIRSIKLSADVYQQVLDRIAAKLELAKAEIEEMGRTRVAELEAATRLMVATHVADAKGQYPKSIGEALVEIGRQPRVLTAYNTLYELGHVRPHRTVVFEGFEASEISAADAAMMLVDTGVKSSS